MIKISISTNNSIIFHILANGHAKCSSNLNVVCASFSFLLRTFFSVLNFENVIFDVICKKKGNLEFKLGSKSFLNSFENNLYYYSNFLIRGLEDLSLEYPNNIKLIIKRSELNGNK